ncbi:MAG: membrane protein insertase YidC [Treponema sp.]|nr:membrane protein insertase YidC [Treponema sp.]MCL2250388.1 membrane protein insertase YidC [Treponema sp.]
MINILDILYSIIIYPIIIILEFSFSFAQKLFRETGISVIFIGIVVSLLCLPLYAVAEKWQQLERTISLKLKPKTDKIKKAFKGDEQYMILTAYYNQNHYHPIYALRSSFGLLVQVPFFIAAYHYLSNLELLKGVSFYFIKDLGAPDALFSINGFIINILPILMTLITIISSFIYTKGLSARDKIQLYGMAVLFLILLYNSPSALVLYWTMNILFSLIKNIYYRLDFKNKPFVLLIIISFLIFILFIFCTIKYYYITKANILSFILFFIACLPWIVFVFRKNIKKIIDLIDIKISFFIFTFSVFLIFCLFGLFLPSQLIISSPQEFSFIDNYSNPLIFIFNTSMQVFGMFVFYPFCFYFLFSNNIKKCFSLIFMSFSILLITNIFLFSGNYGILSINFIFDSSPFHSLKEIIYNLIILIAVLIISVVFFIFKFRKYIPVFLSFCFISLLTISLFNIIKINSSFTNLDKSYVKKEITIKEINSLFSLSKTNKNVVIIMIDRAINGFIPFIFQESPELNAIYSGFVYYPNTVSFNGYTAIGSPPIFGGYEYTPEEINKRDTISLVEKHNQALLMLPKIFSENDFLVTVTDPPYANYSQKCDLSIFDDYPDIKSFETDSKYTDYWLDKNNFNLPLTSDIIKRNMFWYSFFKGTPLFLRSLLYMDGTWCSPVSDQRLRLTLNGYSVLDYLPELTEITAKNKDTLLIMTNNTTHNGSFLQAPDYIPAIPVTNYGTSVFANEHAYHINAAAIKRIGEWITFLKENDVYDNTRIILVADHGPVPNFFTKLDLPFNVDQFNPLLLVKDFNSSNDLKTDHSFMSNADVPYLALTNLIENPVNPFTGNEISVERKKEPLYIAISGSSHVEPNSYKFNFNNDGNYYVHTNIFIKENWIKASDIK